jgi:hypothetical protein
LDFRGPQFAHHQVIAEAHRCLDIIGQSKVDFFEIKSYPNVTLGLQRFYNLIFLFYAPIKRGSASRSGAFEGSNPAPATLQMMKNWVKLVLSQAV